MSEAATPNLAQQFSLMQRRRIVFSSGGQTDCQRHHGRPWSTVLFGTIFESYEDTLGMFFLPSGVVWIETNFGKHQVSRLQFRVAHLG